MLTTILELLPQAKAAAEAPAEGGDKGGDKLPPSKKQKSDKGAAQPAVEETDAEPSFELPDELVEWKGSPSDRKGQLEFRQKQQKERSRLDKEKAKWEVRHA